MIMIIRNIKRICWIGLGILCVILGTVGIFIPGLPTTVFILIALWSFTKSSPRLYNWLINNKYLAAGAKSFLETGKMSRQTKLKIISTISFFCLLAIFIFLPDGMALIKSIIAIFGLIGIIYIMHIPVMK
tara:strand:+ start:581 stop:970 length:390 start_codon:yes stop_codon:yes gene_type:complete